MTIQNLHHNDFQEVKGILLTIKSLINEKTDVIWSRYKNVNEFLEDLNNDIEKIGNCEFEALHRINGEFAPTSTYNEISFSNDWAQEYINLSAKFDKIYQKIKDNGQ